MKNWIIKKIAIKKGNEMINKLDLRSKRILTLVGIFIVGGVDAYLKANGQEMPPVVYQIIAGLGLTSHYVIKK